MAAKRSFDPRAILAALERNYVNYAVIGGLGRVLRGADEITEGVDICPSFGAENLERLGEALGELGARRNDGQVLVLTGEALGSETVVALSTNAGSLQIMASPAGAPNGFVDLRRGATKEHLGQGVQPLVASMGDLARMAAALGRDQHTARLPELRRIMELETDRTQTLAHVGQARPSAGRARARSRRLAR